MLLSISSVGRSECLRTQLRYILLGLSGRPSPRISTPSRSFTNSTRIRQETALEDDEPSQQSKLRIYRDDGSRRERIIGRHGRRQRTSSERLKTASLGRAAEVVLFHDVAEDPSSQQKIAVPRQENDREQRKFATSSTSPRSELEEVMASIEALRPHDTLLEAEQIKQLQQDLAKSYNSEQLRQYLVHHFTQSHKPTHSTPVADANEVDTSIPVSIWQPGRTAIEQRVGRVPLDRHDIAKKKPQLAQEIIRNAWQLITQEDMQQVGELEMYAKSWQTRFLFDLKRGNKQEYEALIDSPLLARATSVRPYRKDNIVRITGRKADVDEVAAYLRAGLAKVRKDCLDLKVFEHLLGTPGWADTLEGLFQTSDLDFISDKTASIFVREADHRLSIYSAADHPQCSHPKRLLLSLLCLPSTSKTFIYEDAHARNELGSTVTPVSKALGNHTRAIELPAMDIHRKNQTQSWYRDIVPSINPATVTAPPVLQTKDRNTIPTWFSLRAATFVDSLPKLPTRSAHMSVSDSDGTWSGLDIHRSWSARIGTLLVSEAHWRHRTRLKTSKREALVSARDAALFVDEAGGKVPLLANFEPLDALSTAQSNSGATKQILVHLQPSPLTAAGTEPLTSLPPLVLTFDMSATTSGTASEPEFHSLTATLADQEVHMPLPDQVADISFSRARTIKHRHEVRRVHSLRPTSKGESHGSCDAEVQHLVDEISIALKTPGATLPSLSSIDIPLPLEVLKGTKSGDNTPYFISHFEQVTITDFIPLQSPARRLAMDPAAHKMAEEWPDWLVLRLREVDAGPLAGRRTEMLLVRNDTAVRGGKTGDPQTAVVEGAIDALDETGAGVEKEEFNPQILAKTAMQLIHLMTKGHAGQLRSPFSSVRT